MSIWTSKFGLSAIIVWFKTQVDFLLNSVLGASIGFEDTKADIRAITGYSDEDYVGCFENNFTYQFDAALTTADNDNTILTPDDITEPAPGRWVKVNEYSTVGHGHSQYANKVGSPTTGDFAGLDANGDLIDSGKKPADYYDKTVLPTEGNLVEYGPGDTLVDSGVAADDVVTEADIDDKMDKISGVVGGDVGKILTVDGDGNADMSGNKLTDFVQIQNSQFIIYNNGTQTLQAGCIRHLIDGDNYKIQQYNGATWDDGQVINFAASGPSGF